MDVRNQTIPRDFSRLRVNMQKPVTRFRFLTHVLEAEYATDGIDESRTFEIFRVSLEYTLEVHI